MGYQALLFCPNEKLSAVVSQLFAELDFHVEVVQEPFAAVKKLMAQQYDAVVFDSENEQNASLLFRSARNSSSNQNSLTIALVEGQAGIAKAYRIGANLVLTKPINVEQAKGTLRVARGLLRKASEGAAAAVPATAHGSSPAATLAPPSGPLHSADSETSMPPILPGPALVEFPVATASARLAEPAVMAPAAETPGRITISAETSAAAQHAASSDDASSDKVQRAGDKTISIEVAETPVTPAARSGVGTGTAASSSAPATKTVSTVPSFAGSAATPAPAREASSPQPEKNRSVVTESAESRDRATGRESTPAEAPNTSAVAALVEESESPYKKMLIAAVIVLSLAALGYFGYGMFVKREATTPPASVSQPHDAGRPAQAPPPTALPASEVAPSTKPLSATENAPAKEVATNQTPSSQAPSQGSETRKPDPSPLRVKSNVVETKPQVQSDEPAPQFPGSDADSANQNSLSGVMSSASPSVPRFSPAAVKISQGVSEGLLIKRVQPRYPQSALAAHAQGAVQIEATINKEGLVIKPRVLAGDPVLAHSALEAVRQWRYKPYYLDGQPVEIQTQITVKFKTN